MHRADRRAEQPAPLTVSLVIPALNEVVYLARLLGSVAKLKRTSGIGIHETIVVDANSSDGTADLARANSCIVVDAEPGQVAASRNLGADRASGNILAFVDADCELPIDWLKVVNTELRHDDVVAVGLSMAASGRETTWIERAWYELVYRHHSMTQKADVNWLATFNLTVRSTAFEQIGGFDESLTTCEDVDISYRLSSLGILRQVYCSSVIHRGESKTVSELYRREAWRARGSTALFAKHWRNPREFVSFLLPFLIVGGFFVSLTLLVACLYIIFNESSGVGPVSALALLIGLFPVTLLTVRRRVAWRMFLPCISLLCVYFVARAQGTLRPFSRVHRKSA